MKSVIQHHFLLFLILLVFIPQGRLLCQNQTVERVGDVLLFAIPATAFGSSLVIGDQEGTWQFTKGLLLNQAITLGLKEIINKPRPHDNGDNAFPSGHTSTAFQGASFIQKRYGWKYGVLAYALAGFTGFSRIQANRHDAWDVLAGAAVGIGSTYLFTTPYLQGQMEITFSSLDNKYVLGFRYKF
ncbi:MAG: phosphatase PAP2 family protein [Eudoraea sp.]|nr:phosphatase PAP2 family protein [Eudoraea sp.]